MQTEKLKELSTFGKIYENKDQEKISIRIDN